MARSRPPRLAADCYQGFGRYFLTICSEGRRETFADVGCVERVREQFLRILIDYAFDAIAYCFMRDHLHALVEATTPHCDFAKFASMFKQRSAFAHKQAADGKLWQESYFDRVLRSDESTLDVVAYILDNPVKAGYCQDPRAYPYLGSTRYSIDELVEAVANHRGRP